MAQRIQEDHAADRVLRDRLAAVALAESGHYRGRVVPDRWLRDPHWRCTHLHVDSGFQRDERGRRVCLIDDCRSPVRLTFPEDISGPLPAPELRVQRPMTGGSGAGIMRTRPGAKW